MKTARGWVALGVVALGTVTAGVALAHHTGNERRTAAECATLETPYHRGQCLRCVSLPVPHHYHPLQGNGHRCDVNDGTR